MCSLQQVLLQPLEDSTRKAASEDVEVSMTSKSKRTIGKVKVQGISMKLLKNLLWLFLNSYILLCIVVQIFGDVGHWNWKFKHQSESTEL
jgi:hypothetical protein